MERARLEQLLERIRGVRVAVAGDFCLDAYWMLDPALAAVSVETGKPTLPVRAQYCSLGGAGNIVSNLAALMEHVERRMRQVQRGQLDARDFTLKGAVEFLKRLRARRYSLPGQRHRPCRRRARGAGPGLCRPVQRRHLRRHERH